MAQAFSETIKQIRTERGLSQQQLADILFVDRTIVSRWESGKRLPDAVVLSRIAKELNINEAMLLSGFDDATDEGLNVILLDDEKIVLTGGLPILQKSLPSAQIEAYTRPSEALDFARKNTVSLAFLDIEMGRVSGFDVCKELLEINPRTNIFFLTAFADYSIDAWSTGACGFILKPLSEDILKEQLKRLRYPIFLKGEEKEC